MYVTRRGFLRISGAALATCGIDISLEPVSAHAKSLRIKYAKETTTICPYCSVGCSIIVSTTSGGRLISTEGDPNSPINLGALCTKGGSLYQMSANRNRLTNPLYRAPNAKEWKEVSWEWALDRIAENVRRHGTKVLKQQTQKAKSSTERKASLR